MARIYQAALYCDACGKAIEEHLTAEGKRPADTLDESSYDSDEYPKYADDHEESDSPEHCDAGNACLDPTIIGGRPYAHFFGNDLTDAGIAYVRDAFTRHPDNALARFWATWYEQLCSDESCKRLTGHACDVCGEPTAPHDCTGKRLLSRLKGKPMDSKSDVLIDDTLAIERATIVHEGREFASGGFSIDVERGRMVGYVHADPQSGGYILTTWNGERLARLERTDNHPRQNARYYLGWRERGPVGFGGVWLESYRTLDPIAGFHWYGRGLGAGMALKLRRGRKA